MISNTDLF